LIVVSAVVILRKLIVEIVRHLSLLERELILTTLEADLEVRLPLSISYFEAWLLFG
jgi:hypothetical protein